MSAVEFDQLTDVELYAACEVALENIEMIEATDAESDHVVWEHESYYSALREEIKRREKP